MKHDFPNKVTIVEVGPRDGLQSERNVVSKRDKIDFINQLSETGLSAIEVGSLVSPSWVPQMANSAAVYQEIDKRPGIKYSLLVPNRIGLDKAVAANAKHVAVFAAASEAFSQKNINCNIADSLHRYDEIVARALSEGIQVRGYVSCVMGCPYQGDVDVERVIEVASALYEMGCYEIALGDTIGTGTASRVEHLIDRLCCVVPVQAVAVHFHDTYGQALSNCLMALSCGISTIDAALAGLGGCPYAQGASGNLATEDLLYLLHGMNIETGVDMQKLMAVSQFICQVLDQKPQSKVSLLASQSRND